MTAKILQALASASVAASASNYGFTAFGNDHRNPPPRHIPTHFNGRSRRHSRGIEPHIRNYSPAGTPTVTIANAPKVDLQSHD